MAKRPRQEFVDSTASEGLSEPLLGDEYEDWKETRSKEEHEKRLAMAEALCRDPQTSSRAKLSSWLQLVYSRSFWFLLVLSSLTMLVAFPVSSLLFRLYYINGGSHRWLLTWVVSAAVVLMGSGKLVGGVVHRVLHRRQGTASNANDFEDLTPVQLERLQKLQKRLQIPYDGTKAEHREALLALWHEAYPGRELDGLVSEQWKEMGWQGRDPSTDFRGGGFISLENLLFFAQHYPKSFSRLLRKEEGKRATWEYPFAVAGINVSSMLIQMLDLRSEKPSSRSGHNFLKILAEDEQAFDVLYCVAFEMMDAQWLAMRASYMEFNAVLKATRSQLERELSVDNVHRVEDLPAYTLLCR